MIQSRTQRWFGAVAFAIFVAIGPAAHASEKKVHEKHDASALNASLRDVIDVGIKLFNDQGDHAGCYRLYQGALLSVRPFLAPDLQKTVDEGFGNADKLATFSDRAFALRKVIDHVRASAKREIKKQDENSETKKGDIKLDVKKIISDENKKDDGKDKKVESPKDGGLVSGKVTFDGMPLKAAFTMVFVAKDGKEHRAASKKDGAFQFETPLAEGAYRVAIEAAKDSKPAVPARYMSVKESGLEVTVQKGKQTITLNLVP